MAVKRYADAVFVKLDTYITPDRFRTILPEMRSIPGGLTEVPVEFSISAPLMKKLPEGISADGITVYGFVRLNDALRERFGEALAERRDCCRITFSDWDDRLLFLCETGKQDIPAFVTPDEGENLLQNCLHASPSVFEE